jgi:hypothetical protein
MMQRVVERRRFATAPTGRSAPAPLSGSCSQRPSGRAEDGRARVEPLLDRPREALKKRLRRTRRYAYISKF